MRVINHALTGSIIGLMVHEPLLAVPVAVASHFVCDAIPHYDGLASPKPSLKLRQKWIRSSLFKRLLYADAILSVALVAVLADRHPVHWLLASICAFAAAAPDLLWLPRYLKRRQAKMSEPKGFDKFAGRIQWFQRPIGAVVEVTWFFGAIVLLIPLLT